MIKYTRFHKILEILSLLFLLLSLVIFFLNWLNLPEQIPVHFDLNGVPNRIGNRMELLLIPGIGILFYLLMLLPRIIPCRYWNTPLKLTDVNRSFVYSALFSMTQIIKLETIIFWSIITFFSSTMQAPPVWIVFSFGPVSIITVIICYIKILIKIRNSDK